VAAASIAGCRPAALYAGAAFGDVPLAALALAAALYLTEWQDGGPPGTLLLGALAAGLLPWTKREGAMLVLALCIALPAAGRLRRRAWLGAGAAALAAARLAGPWWAWMAWNGVATNAFAPVTLSAFLDHAARLPAIGALAGGALAGAWWAGLWLVVPAVALLEAARGLRFAACVRRAAGWLPASALCSDDVSRVRPFNLSAVPATRGQFDRSPGAARCAAGSGVARRERPVHSRPHLVAVAQALLVVCLWATSWVLMKVGLRDLPALTFAGLRYALAALCVLPFALRGDSLSALRRMDRGEWLRLALFGLLQYTITQGAAFVGLVYLPAATANMVFSLTSVLVALLALAWLGERPSAGQWAGVGVYTAGVGLYFFPVDLSSGQVIGRARRAGRHVRCAFERDQARRESRTGHLHRWP
jgi:uncharacterized membrane protein